MSKRDKTPMAEAAAKEANDALSLNRRDFVKAGSAGVVGLAAATALPSLPAQAAIGPAYPVVDIAPVDALTPNTIVEFVYPDEASPAVLVRLAEAGDGGVGPNQEIVAYSQLCTPKGCPVAYRSRHKLFVCPCHWSTFDPAKAGTLVIGQASHSLPQITLRVSDGMVQAVGMTGLIYGRHTNIV